MTVRDIHESVTRAVPNGVNRQEEANREIDILNEDLILVRDLPGYLPKQPSGKKLHLSACYRWMKPGLQGVRLETVFIAGSRYTSKQAVNRFWHRVTERKDGKPNDAKPSNRAKSTSDQELKNAGW